MDIRHAVGVRKGVSAEKLTDILRYRESPRYSERERAALDFCERITRDDLDVSEECLARLREHFTEPEVVELTFIIGYQTFANKFAKAAGAARLFFLIVGAARAWRAAYLIGAASVHQGDLNGRRYPRSKDWKSCVHPSSSGELTARVVRGGSRTFRPAVEHLPDAPCQLFGQERLGEERAPGTLHAMPTKSIGGVA
jgi:hypothetical protein